MGEEVIPSFFELPATVSVCSLLARFMLEGLSVNNNISKLIEI